jgi:hypothetical protein
MTAAAATPFAPSVAAMRRSRSALLFVIAAFLLASAPSITAATVPVRVRIIKGSRQGPASVDPKLADLHGQLGRLAYQKWEEVGQQHFEMDWNKPVSMGIPDGSSLELTLLSGQKNTVTFQVRVPQKKTNSRLTISKEQRIVHQVADEKNGEAYFATIRPWP